MATYIGGAHIERPSYGTTAADVEHECLVIECKLRETLALEGWLKQAEKHSEPGKLTVVISKAKNLSDSKSIVSLRIDDFLDLIS